MGCRRVWYILAVIFLLCLSYSSSSFGETMNNNISAANSLDILLQKYAFKELSVHDNRRTGSLYHPVLPRNLSGIKISVVRLRSGSFWIRGANFSDFRIPPRFKPIPYVKRLAIVYQNLGNLSSQYYNVPGYSMVTPVIGFIAYNATNLNTVKGMKKLANLASTKTQISIHFTLPSGLNISQAKCVKFNESGSPSFTEMKYPNICLTNDQGHFTVVTVPLEPLPRTEEKKKNRLLVWLILSIAFGVFALLFIVLLGFVVYRMVGRRRISGMEKEAENGEAFETIWVGNSKMPSATSMRTNPIIEYSESAPY